MINTTTLIGEQVRLRPVEERDLPLFSDWLNDPDVRYWQHRSEDALETMESERRWYEGMRNDPARMAWCIETRVGQPIGSLGLMGLGDTHRRAELYIFIGKNDWSRGYGTDAIRCVLRYAFQEMGLRRVHLITDEDNARGIRCYEKCGFVREGLLRAHRLRHGKPIDMIVMGALRDEWGRE